jgi:hypothetical protein
LGATGTDLHKGGEVYVVDLFGKTIVSKTIGQGFSDHQLTIELDPSMPSGYYLVKVTNGEKLGTKTFVKID